MDQTLGHQVRRSIAFIRLRHDRRKIGVLEEAQEGQREAVSFLPDRPRGKASPHLRDVLDPLFGEGVNQSSPRTTLASVRQGERGLDKTGRFQTRDVPRLLGTRDGQRQGSLCEFNQKGKGHGLSPPGSLWEADGI
ncbi:MULTISPECIES: hypothetical protein [unclassified Variovorax]|uniref:hypothetical protein n=1 Tax=unclassified Variovorax TaxID=663243 RepID=UPI000B86FAA7|nr:MULTISPECIES: hypothetical protein [unclassified Variovorax]